MDSPDSSGGSNPEPRGKPPAVRPGPGEPSRSRTDEILCDARRSPSPAGRWPAPSATQPRSWREQPTTAVCWGQLWSLLGGALQNTNLMAQRQVLQLHGSTGAEDQPQGGEQCGQNEHRSRRYGEACNRHYLKEIGIYRMHSRAHALITAKRLVKLRTVVSAWS